MNTQICVLYSTHDPRENVPSDYLGAKATRVESSNTRQAPSENIQFRVFVIGLGGQKLYALYI